MEFKRIKFTEQCLDEIFQIYDYIFSVLKEKQAAERLLIDTEKKIKRLFNSPELYMEIDITDRLERKYRRIVVKNYVILYTIDYNKHIVIISHMFYGKSNYLNFKNF